jgi:succinyl-CoA synthetase alpha subunit
MAGQLTSQQLRLPFLDSQQWRVAVIAPTGRYAHNQVTAMTAAGTPIVGGVALGRGGTSLDGLPLYDRIGDLPEPPTIALIYTPAEGVRDAIAECAGARIPTIMAVAEYVPVHDTLAAAAPAVGSSVRIRSASLYRDADCSVPSRRASAPKAALR